MATTKPPSLLDLRTPADIAGFPGLPKPKPAPKAKPKAKKKKVSKPLNLGIQARLPGPVEGTDVYVGPNPKTKKQEGKIVYSGTKKKVDPVTLAAAKHGVEKSDYIRALKNAQNNHRRDSSKSVQWYLDDQLQGHGQQEGTNLIGAAHKKNKPAPLGLPAVAKTVRPVGAVTKKVVENLPSAVIGPSIVAGIEGKHVSPGGVALDAIGFLPFGYAARSLKATALVADALRSGSTIEEARVIAGAAMKGIRGNPPDLVLQIGKKGTEASKTLTGPASRSPVLGGMQRAAVKIAQKGIGNPETTPLEQQVQNVAKGFPSLVAKHLTKNEQFYGNIFERGSAEALVGQTLRTPKETAETLIRGGGVTSPKQMALKMVLEDTTPAKYIKTLEGEIAAARENPQHFADVAKLKQKIKLARAAEKHYLDIVPKGTVVSPRMIPASSVGTPNTLEEMHRVMSNDGVHLYHSTDSSLFSKIKDQGLLPGKARKGELTGVYLAEDGTDVLSLRPDRPRNNDIWLRVKKSSINPIKTDMYPKSSQFSEFVSKERIAPENIEYFGVDGKWHPVSKIDKSGELTSVLKAPTTKHLKNLHKTLEDVNYVGGQREAAKLRLGDFASKHGKFTPEEIMAMRKGLPRLVDQGARVKPIMEPFDPLHVTSGKYFIDGRPGRILGHEGNDVLVEMFTRGKKSNYRKTVSPDQIQKEVGQRFEWPDGTPVTPQEMMSGGRGYISAQIGRVRGASKAQTVSDVLPFEPMGESRASYAAEARLSGRESVNVTQMVGQKALVVQRRDRFMRELTPLQALAIRSPQAPKKGKWTLAKLTRDMSPSARQAIDDALYKSDNGIVLSRTEKDSIDKFMDTWKDDFLPKIEPNTIPEDFGWVPSSLVGDLKKPFLVAGQDYGTVADVAKYVAGSLNDIVKAAVIYAKFGYIAPNLAGNLALNLFQQGPMLIPTMETVAKMAKQDSWVSRFADSQMGSGVMQSFLAGNPERRFSQRVLGTLAHVQSVPTDRYTRRASYFYEFAKATGISVSDHKALAAAIRTLSRAQPGTDGARLMISVAQRARLAAIEYERLSPIERKAIAPIVFILPWMKGATRFSFAFPFEHPVQAAALAAAWKINEERNKRMIANYGNRPPWQEHITAVGGTPENPVVTNWGNILPFTSAEEVGKAFVSMARNNPPGFAEGPASLISPTIEMAIEAAYGRNPMTGTQTKGNPVLSTGLDFLKQSPVYSDFFAGAPKPTATTQRSRVQHLIHAFLGSPSPTTIAPSNFTGGGKLSKDSLDKLVRKGLITRSDEREILQLQKQYGK